MSAQWTAEDSIAAQAQGWDLFEIDFDDCTQQPIYEIQKCDESDIFGDDIDANLYVCACATRNEALAVKALILEAK